MLSICNGIFVGSNERESVYDLELPSNFNGKIILFVHGYKGFKDWGAWNVLQQTYLNKGFGFCKFNMSHNGGTVSNPIDFPDLEAFANNRYSYEVYDCNQVIDLIHFKVPQAKIILLGHSRGGGISLLCASNSYITGVITLAAISSIEYRFRHTEIMEKWKKEGVRYELNTRTKQNMPLFYSQYTDFLSHKDELNIEQACRTNTKPMLHFHGNQDDAILIEEGEAIASWTNNPLIRLENCNHTFETTHPWNKQALSNPFSDVVQKSLDFLAQIN